MKQIGRRGPTPERSKQPAMKTAHVMAVPASFFADNPQYQPGDAIEFEEGADASLLGKTYVLALEETLQ